MKLSKQINDLLLGLSTSKTSYDYPGGRQILTDIYLDEARTALLEAFKKQLHEIAELTYDSGLGNSTISFPEAEYARKRLKQTLASALLEHPSLQNSKVKSIIKEVLL